MNRVAVVGAGASSEFGLPLASSYFAKDYLEMYQRVVQQIVNNHLQITKNLRGREIPTPFTSDLHHWCDLRDLQTLKLYIARFLGYTDSRSKSYGDFGVKEPVNVEELYEFIVNSEEAQSADLKWTRSEFPPDRSAGRANAELLLYIWAVTWLCSTGRSADRGGSRSFRKLWTFLGDEGSVITFNWDTLSSGRSAVQQEPRWPPQVRHTSSLVFHLRIAPELEGKGYWLPLHGSVDSLYCPNCTLGRSLMQPDAVNVCDEDWRNILNYHQQRCSYCCEPVKPLMLPPDAVKDISAHDIYNRLWAQAEKELQDADEIIVCGFRWSERDGRARNLLRSAINEAGKNKRIIVCTKRRQGESDEKAVETVRNLYKKILRPAGSPRKYRLDRGDIFLDGFAEFVETRLPALM